MLSNLLLHYVEVGWALLSFSQPNQTLTKNKIKWQINISNQVVCTILFLYGISYV